MTSLKSRLLDALKAQGKTLATAESCTGGLLGKRLTDLPGSSAAYVGGVISYSNGVKEKLLGVSHSNLEMYGAVSEPVARQMCEGVRARLGADFGVGITGIAGPASDDTKKPVGLVYIAVTDGERTACDECHFSGTREQIRTQSAEHAMEMLLNLL